MLLLEDVIKLFPGGAVITLGEQYGGMILVYRGEVIGRVSISHITGKRKARLRFAMVPAVQMYRDEIFDKYARSVVRPRTNTDWSFVGPSLHGAVKLAVDGFQMIVDELGDAKRGTPEKDMLNAAEDRLKIMRFALSEARAHTVSEGKGGS